MKRSVAWRGRSLNDSALVPESRALTAAPASPAWEHLHRNLLAGRDSSWFDIQDVGPEVLRWRLALIDTATTSLDAQYFIWKQDAVGSLLLERLLQAADRGVRVRLLLDDSFLSGEDALILAVDAHPNIELRIFNPFQVRADNMLVRYAENLNEFSRINHRMHNKLLISDGEVTIVGMLLSGIIGLFVGAVVLATGYTLFMAWLDQDQQGSGEQASAES